MAKTPGSLKVAHSLLLFPMMQFGECEMNTAEALEAARHGHRQACPGSDYDTVWYEGGRGKGVHRASVHR